MIMITKPKPSSGEVYKLTYEECGYLISKISYSKISDIFGKEKGKGVLKGIKTTRKKIMINIVINFLTW